MGGTVAAVGPMDQPVVAAAPIEEVFVTQPQVVESTPEENWESKLGKVNLYNGPKAETIVPVMPLEDVVPPQPFTDESLPEATRDSKISDRDPCDDPMDEMLRQKEHVATTGGLAN